MVRIGTAGWQYRDWAGIVYPKPKPRGFDELSSIASFFSTVEINSSFYGPPRRQVAMAWNDRVADNAQFRFTAKLWKGFTHERNATAKDEALFKDGMAPLMNPGVSERSWSSSPGPSAMNRKTERTFVAYEIALRSIPWLSKCGMAVGWSPMFWMNSPSWA